MSKDIEGMGDWLFMQQWRKTEDTNMKWKLIKFLAKLNIKAACETTGVLYFEDGTSFQGVS